MEAHLVALNCSAATEGHQRLALRLLADKAVEMGYVDSISYETVRRVLKKTSFIKPWEKDGWIIPSLGDGNFVAHMKIVLDVYKQPYDPLYPVVYMDKSPKQLIAETRTPIPATPGQLA